MTNSLLTLAGAILTFLTLKHLDQAGKLHKHHNPPKGPKQPP